MLIAGTERTGQQKRVTPLVGSLGNADDNALAESVRGLFKAEVIRQLGPWRNVEAVEFATLT